MRRMFFTGDFRAVVKQSLERYSLYRGRWITIADRRPLLATLAPHLCLHPPQPSRNPDWQSSRKFPFRAADSRLPRSLGYRTASGATLSLSLSFGSHPTIIHPPIAKWQYPTHTPCDETSSHGNGRSRAYGGKARKRCLPFAAGKMAAAESR